MKTFWIIWLTIIVLLLGWGVLLSLLIKQPPQDRFHDASTSMGFSVAREIFLDSVEIFVYDTIVTNDSSQFLFPVSAWVEKRPVWAEYVNEPTDSVVQFSRDTLRFVVTFDSFIDHGTGHNVVDFVDQFGKRTSLNAYEMLPMALSIPVTQVMDTIWLSSNRGERFGLLIH